MMVHSLVMTSSLLMMPTNSSKYSKAVLDKYYSVPASVKNSNKALAGTSMFFNVDEEEVFYLDPSN